MQNQMIWALYTEFSRHMWGNNPERGNFWYSLPSYKETNDVDLAVWDEMVRYAAETGVNMLVIDLGDAVQYETHPEIAAPDAWSKDFLKQKLDEMRKLGIEPIPKLNFSATHDTWLKEYRRMISTPTYYRVCSDLIGEVCELFGNPRLFHLGYDEEDAGVRPCLEMMIVRNSELWWHDLFFLFNECEKRGARPWVWAHYCNNHADEFTKKMPHSALLSNWMYHEFRDYKETEFYFKQIRTYAKLTEAGFAQVPAISTVYGHDENARETMYHFKEVLKAEHIEGYMATSWVAVCPGKRFRILNEIDQFQRGRKEIYPDSF